MKKGKSVRPGSSSGNRKRSRGPRVQRSAASIPDSEWQWFGDAGHFICGAWWQWFGDAGHFICGAWCRFHLATQIGDILVSTVGRYYPRHKSEEEVPKDGEDIGFGRTYETMAFKVTGELCSCGCGIPTIIPSEIEFDGYNDAKSARRGHMAICRKVAARVPVRSKRP